MFPGESGDSFVGDARRPVAVDPDGAAVDEPLDPLRGCRLQQMPGAVEVDGLEELVALAALPHGHGKVEDVSRSPRRPPAQLGIGDAAGEHLGAHPGQQLSVGLFLGAVGQAEHHHLGPAAPALFGQMRADEAGAAGDQKSHPNRSASACHDAAARLPSP